MTLPFIHGLLSNLLNDSDLYSSRTFTVLQYYTSRDGEVRQMRLLLLLIQGWQEYWWSQDLSCLTLEQLHSINLPHFLQVGGGGTLQLSLNRLNSVPGRYTGVVEADTRAASART